MPTRRGSSEPDLDAAVAFLLDRQDEDGLWRDYALPPGASETWTTSVAGLALTPFPAAAPALVRARRTVSALRRADGWGYNSATATDADTTSFALRFVGGDPSVLGRFVDLDGNAHTFVGAQFGSWAWAHADVTATVGLALDDARAARAATLRAREHRGAWRSFWWTTDTYATARSLELLAKTGSIPREVADDVGSWLEHAPPPETAFEAAQLVVIAKLLSRPTAGHAAALR